MVSTTSIAWLLGVAALACLPAGAQVLPRAGIQSTDVLPSRTICITTAAGWTFLPLEEVQRELSLSPAQSLRLLEVAGPSPVSISLVLGDASYGVDTNGLLLVRPEARQSGR